MKTEMTNHRDNFRYTLATFILLVMVSVIILKTVNYHTKDIITENKLLVTRKTFNDIITTEYTNDIFNDTIKVIDPAYLGSNQTVTIYRIRNNENPVGVLIHPVIAKGYKSEIELGISISTQGIIMGVRILNENETEGLGDQIHQDKTNWIIMFTGKSYENLPRDQWLAKSDNGYFDQISGATITSRSVINRVRKTLDFHNISGDILYKQ
ncbi:MAG: electron transport complex protein RnfG [Gammaproteobacteria bacterium]